MAGQLKLKDFLNPSKAKRKGDDDNDGGDEKKKKREEEDDKEKQAKGKTKRQFKPSWQVGREWLKYDSTKKVMFCSYCRERGNIVKSKAFINGTDSFKIDTIWEHEGSQGHKDCRTGEMNAKKKQFPRRLRFGACPVWIRRVKTRSNDSDDADEDDE